MDGPQTYFCGSSIHRRADENIADVTVDTSGPEHKLSEINTDHTTGLSLPPPVNRINSGT